MKRFSWPAGLVLGLTFLLQACGAPEQTDTVGEPRPAKLLKLSEQSEQASNSFPAVIRSVRSCSARQRGPFHSLHRLHVEACSLGWNAEAGH